MNLSKSFYNFKTILLFTFFLIGSKGAIAQTYCAATHSDCGFEVITNVNLANINNTSGCGLPYDDYTSQVANIAPGTNVNGTISKSDILTNYIAMVFVDWNNDGTFDATEQITTNLQGTSMYTFTVSPPITATNGLKRMRVRMAQNAVPTSCGPQVRGDTEDYTINLTTAAYPAPANDLCSSPVILTPTSTCSNTGGSTLGATQSLGPNSCGTGLTANDLWYSFTANGISEYEIRATGNGAGTALFDPIIEFYSGCSATNYISCANATGPNMSEVITTGTLAAGTYYYRVYGNGSKGNFTTCVVDITPQPGNDCDAPLVLTDLNNSCSVEQRYNNFGAITSSYGPPSCWATTSKDVWFSFTAVEPNVRIDVFGLGSGGNTLQQPQIALYSGACAGAVLTEGCAQTSGGSNNAFLSIGGLAVGTTYLIRVDSQNGHEGTFQLCINNFDPPVLPGQDCATARVLCTKDQIVETNVTGFGADGLEAAGSCLAGGVSPGLNTEENTAWYTWTAADNGTIGFDIIPSSLTPNLDVDFVLFVLDPVNGCAGKTMIRCMGSSCTGPTGLNLASIDVTEPSDCDPLVQDNYLQALTQTAGTKYGLLINNFQNGGSGFTLNINGTGNFLGPQPGFTIAPVDPCVVPQTITITDTSINADTYLWNFGADANPATANTEGPHTVTYSTAGTKTITLTVNGAGGCDSTIQVTYVVAAPLNATATVVNSVCDLPNGSLTVNTTGGNGSSTAFSYQLNSGTAQNSNQFNNIVGGTYTVDVTDTSGCLFSFTSTVGNTPTPDIAPIADVTSCYEYQLPAISGTNLTGSEAYYSMPNGAGTMYSAGQIINASTTLYAYDATNSVPVCTDEEAFNITITEAPLFQNLVETCNPGNTAYAVSFDIIGGDAATYSVFVENPVGGTGTLSGTSWASNPITNATTYSIEISDANGCPPTVVSGYVDCNCTTDAGNMGTTMITVCGSGALTATHVANSYVNDGNDTLQYVLHDASGPALGTIFAVGYTPTFSFAPGMAYGTTYYISALAGNNNGFNQVDQTDPCMSVASGTPVRWRETPTADISGSTAICNGETADLTFTLTGASPFNLTFNNGSSNQTANNVIDQGNITVSPSVTRNYTLVSVTGANGCSGTVSSTIVTITVNTPPTVSPEIYTCNAASDGYSVSFDVTDGTGGPYTFNIVSPAGVTGSFLGNTFTTSDNIPSGTSYIIEIDDANGCGPVVVQDIHDCACISSAGLMSQQAVSLCESDVATPAHNQSSMILDGDDVLTYILHDQVGNNIGNVIATNNTNSTFAFQAGMTYGVTYYISAAVGNDNGSGLVDLNDPCLSVASGTPVTWNQTPTTTAGVVTNPVCSGQPLELTATNSPNSSFSWTHSGSGFTSNQQNWTRPNSSVSMSGTYTVTVEDNSSGCSSTSSVSVTVNQTPNTTISNNPAGPFCSADNPVQLNASTTGGTWSGNGITNAAQGTFSPSAAGAGQHVITYSINGACPSSSTRTIVVNQTPNADFSSNVQTGCSDLEVLFTANDLTNTSYSWNMGDATPNQTVSTFDYTYPAGIYTVSLTAQKNGCTATISKNSYISVDQTPTAMFAYSGGSDGLIQFENLTLNADSYTWNFGDEMQSTDFSPEHQYTIGGEYLVQLVAVGDGGCTSTFSESINVSTGQTMFIPNAFTPNNDESNQYFLPVLGGDIDYSTYSMEIFNRWGQLIFKSLDPTVGWDGTYLNQVCDEGIYTYSVKFKSTSTDFKVEQKGTISLLK